MNLIMPVLDILSCFGKVEGREVGEDTGHLRPIVFNESVEAPRPCKREWETIS